MPETLLWYYTLKTSSHRSNMDPYYVVIKQIDIETDWKSVLMTNNGPERWENESKYGM